MRVCEREADSYRELSHSSLQPPPESEAPSQSSSKSAKPSKPSKKPPPIPPPASSSKGRNSKGKTPPVTPPLKPQTDSTGEAKARLLWLERRIIEYDIEREEADRFRQQSSQTLQSL